MEAETFRHQSWNQYGNYGGVLKTKTTVGKGVPMGDCFRVEDEWILEQQSSVTNDNCPPSLALSVKFRIVFTKSTMFQRAITKNVVSETKCWFDGYQKMMKAALLS